MLRRLLLTVAGVSLLAVHVASAHAALLFAQLYPLTGEIRIENPSSSAVPFVLYSINATGGALNGTPSVWTSITQNYDAPFGATPGNGFIDPTNEWSKISVTPSELTEGVFAGPGGSLTAFRTFTLGRVWNPATIPAANLSFQFTEPNGQPISVTTVQLAAGDYNRNGVVDAADYVAWRNSFGMTTGPAMQADGNLNGVVDAADYAVWRSNFGRSLLGSGAGAAASLGLSALNAVPEPASAMLCAVGIGFLVTCRRCLRRR